MRFPRAQEMEVEKFDLTAMIDIVLLLIIFFTLTAQFASVTRSPMRLPAETGIADPPAKMSVVVDLAKDGTMLVLGSAVSETELIRLVRGDVARSGVGGSFELIVRADRDAPSAHLNRLAEAMSKAGVRNWKLATSGEGAEGAGGRGGSP